MGTTDLAWNDELLDRLEIGLTLTDLPCGRVRWVNAAACRILGRERTELVGATWDSVATSSTSEGWAEVCGWLGSGGPVPRHPVRFVRSDGDLVHVLISTSAPCKVMADELDLSCRLGQILDVTESETVKYHYQIIFENTPISLTLIKPSGQVLISGGGVAPEIIEDMKAAERTSVFDAFTYAPQGLELVQRAMAGELAGGLVEALGRCYDLHAKPICRSAGEVDYVAAISTDVTERERARADQSTLAELAHQALRTEDPDWLWARAAGLLARRLDATIIVYSVEPGAEPTPVASAGTTPPAAVVRESLAPTPCGRSIHQHAPCVNAEGGDIPTSGRVGGWCTLSAPLGQTGAPAAMLAVYRADEPDPADSARSDRRAGPSRVVGPFSSREREFVGAVASVLGSAAVRFAMERQTRYHAVHDSLTDLPNRVALFDRLRHDLRGGPHDRSSTGVIFVDLDGFKTVNDTFGHRAGDEVLRQAAARLLGSVRPGDVVARLAGDEFAVVCERVAEVAEVEQVAHRLLAEVQRPMELAGTEITITASAGVAVSGDELTDPDHLLSAADFAMYAAKRAGPGRCATHQTQGRPI